MLSFEKSLVRESGNKIGFETGLEICPIRIKTKSFVFLKSAYLKEKQRLRPAFDCAYSYIYVLSLTRTSTCLCINNSRLCKL